MTYAELQQRRARIDAFVNRAHMSSVPVTDCIRALLDDADCGEPPPVFVHEAYGYWSRRYAAYAAALSIAEKELGL